MTMTPAELQRKVRQLDHDVGSIYELLIGLQATLARQGNAVGRIDDRLTAVDDRLDSHSDHFDAIGAALGRLEEGTTEVLALLRAG